MHRPLHLPTSPIGAFDALPNLRDLSSSAPSTVRPGAVFRSAVPAFATAADQRRIVDLGISQVIDLRGVDERSELPSELPGVSTHAIPLFSSPWDLTTLDPSSASVAGFLAERYVELLERSALPIADVLHTIASHDGATLVHCTAGKDRTGVVMAVLGCIAGATRDELRADYVLTMQAMPQLAHLLGEHHRRRSAEGRQSAHAGAAGRAILMSAPLQAIDAVLDRVHGRSAEYLDSIGIGSSLRERLERHLRLEPASSTDTPHDHLARNPASA